MTKLIVQVNRLSLSLAVVVFAGAFGAVSCGEQNSPVLREAAAKQDPRAEAEILNARSGNAVRASSSDDSEPSSGPSGERLEVFSGRLEPLTLQKGGVAKIVLPLSSELGLKAKLRSVAFVSESSGLKESSVQGKMLNLVVADDAAEGRHEGKVVVRFENGSEFSQSISITVLP